MSSKPLFEYKKYQKGFNKGLEIGIKRGRDELIAKFGISIHNILCELREFNRQLADIRNQLPEMYKEGYMDGYVDVE